MPTAGNTIDPNYAFEIIWYQLLVVLSRHCIFDEGIYTALGANIKIWLMNYVLFGGKFPTAKQMAEDFRKLYLHPTVLNTMESILAAHLVNPLLELRKKLDCRTSIDRPPDLVRKDLGYSNQQYTPHQGTSPPTNRNPDQETPCCSKSLSNPARLQEVATRKRKSTDGPETRASSCQTDQDGLVVGNVPKAPPIKTANYTKISFPNSPWLTSFEDFLAGVDEFLSELNKRTYFFVPREIRVKRVNALSKKPRKRDKVVAPENKQEHEKKLADDAERKRIKRSDDRNYREKLLKDLKRESTHHEDIYLWAKNVICLQKSMEPKFKEVVYAIHKFLTNKESQLENEDTYDKNNTSRSTDKRQDEGWKWELDTHRELNNVLRKLGVLANPSSAHTYPFASTEPAPTRLTQVTNSTSYEEMINKGSHVESPVLSTLEKRVTVTKPNPREKAEIRKMINRFSKKVTDFDVEHNEFPSSPKTVNQAVDSTSYVNSLTNQSFEASLKYPTSNPAVNEDKSVSTVNIPMEIQESTLDVYEAKSVLELIAQVYGNSGNPEEKREIFRTSTIVVLDGNTNTVLDINNRTLQLLCSEEYILRSIDRHDSSSNPPAKSVESYNLAKSVEKYNLANPHGYPYHELKLKVGAVVVLLKDHNIKDGVIKGTRLIVEEISNDLKRLLCSPLDPKLPRVVTLHQELFKPPKHGDTQATSFTRHQFPIQLAFAMTPEQGPTASTWGLILKNVYEDVKLYADLFNKRTVQTLCVYNQTPGPVDLLKIRRQIFGPKDNETGRVSPVPILDNNPADLMINEIMLLPMYPPSVLEASPPQHYVDSAENHLSSLIDWIARTP